MTAREAAEAAFNAEGLTHHTWSSSAGYTYGEHSHPYDKVLFCVEGSITFYTPQGDIELTPGDRMDLPAGTTHGATVGSEGVTCMEAARS